MGLFWLGFSLLASATVSSLSSASLRDSAMYDLSLLLAALVILTYSQAYEEQHCGEADTMLREMSGIISQGDEYIIENDTNYEIEICFRYYFPELVKTDAAASHPAGRNLWYILRTDNSGSDRETVSSPFDLSRIASYSFDRYSFVLYRVLR